MQGIRTIGLKGLRWAGGISATLWAGVHFVLASHAAFPHNVLATEIYDTFFAFTASLAIVSAIVFLLGIKNLYLPSLIFYVIDLALLTETVTLLRNYSLFLI